MKIENYLDHMLLDIYSILEHDKTPWPRDFRAAQKHVILDTLLDYFLQKEDYEKCSTIRKIKNHIK
jgi:uncharacterized membrane protein